MPVMGPEWLVFSPAGELVARFELPMERWAVSAFGVGSLVAMGINAETGLQEIRVYDIRKPAQRSQSCNGAERDFPVGSVTEVRTGSPPCRIRIREVGIRLEPSGDGTRPDPGRTVVVDSNGRFISANAIGWPATISVWDARGRHLHSFGREGGGPGEFSTMGMMNLLVDGGDRLHVRDGSLQWSVFSPEHRYLRRVPTDVMGGLRGTTVVLDDGSAVASDAPWRDGAHHFRLADSTGALHRSFGPVGDGASGRGSRPIAYGGGDTFWAAPGEEGADAFVLEEWGTDGELRRRLRRDVAWYRWRGHRETSPAVPQLHVGPGGLLYVLIWRPTREYRREFERARRRGEEVPRDLRDRLTEVVVEVIDTRSGRLLASEAQPLSQARLTLPRSLFRGSFVGYRYEEGPAGPVVEVVSVELVRN